MDDDGLLVRVAAGDDTALGELFCRHAPWVAARLRSVLSAADVEAVLQETFLAVWKGAGGYRPDGSVSGWMWGIARRQAALFLRRRGPAALLLPVVVAADGRQANDPAEAALSRAQMTDAVAALGPEGSPDREVWRLMYIEDRPVAEVAELVGVPVGTVRSRAHRARRRLRAARHGGGGRHMMSGPDVARDGLAAPLGGRRDAVPSDVDLGRVWLGVAAQVWRRQPGWLERLAGRLLRSPGLARALVTTPSLLVGWITATAVVLVAGILATLGTGMPYVALVAPAVAAAGIAYAYGPGIDPAWELSCSMAVSDRMVLLVRALAVFGLNAALGLAAAAASGAAAAVTFGWLVPMTAVCALALAAATLARSANVGVAAGLAGWAITVLTAQAATGRFTAAVTESALVVPYLAFAAGCGAIVVYATRIPRGTS